MASVIVGRQFRKRRCLLEEECKDLDQRLQLRQYWKVLQDGRCVEDCPSGYTEQKNDRHRCQKCEGPCPKGEQVEV